ncbi:MAG: ribokinase/xylose isomerase [Monoraphidium minutum]|nr:MAG: ribokinase/xylose isomerase [Monoraphidium minutum]
MRAAPRHWAAPCALLPLLLALHALLPAPRAAAAAAASAAAAPKPLLIVGSVNADTTISVERLPARGECITSTKPAPALAVGGKGANQAVAAARLRAPGAPPPRFVGRFGDDAHGAWMRAELEAAGVDLSGSETAKGIPSGAGVVWLDAGGAATSVVLGGANAEGWAAPGGAAGGGAALRAAAAAAVAGAGALLLQREVPEFVNRAYAEAAAAAGVPVLLDAGGEDAPLDDSILEFVNYLCPNEIELARLTAPAGGGGGGGGGGGPAAAAGALLARGARRVLATLGEGGALLLMAPGGDASGNTNDGKASGGGVDELRQGALPVPGGVVVDATAAGDAFRAAFATALVEGAPPPAALRFAAAAGAAAVAGAGAMPSLPGRAEVEALLAAHPPAGDAASAAGGGAAAAEGGAGACAAGGEGGGSCTAAADAGAAGGCPLKFASRLNSMAARRDLIAPRDLRELGDGAIGYIRRQGRVQGLDLVYFNYPQHLEGREPQKVARELATAGLAAGGVALRFPPRFRLGALTNPDAALRAAALELGLAACGWAAELGAAEVVVWSAFDGYDYGSQADYDLAWRREAEGLAALADGCGRGVNVSLEWKPTDASSRFSFVPSTAAALMVAGRPNLGLTLDTGHMLMAGENPAQSAALVLAAGKLFGVHLNDGHSRVGAEDGLIFGSVHAAAALELVYWLRRGGYTGSVYFDTFPLNEDPVREAELNIRRFKALWAQAGRLAGAGLDAALAAHDALGAMELMEATAAAPA